MPTVLLVDDEPGIRGIVRAYLEADGFTVREAGSGRIAPKHARSAASTRAKYSDSTGEDGDFKAKVKKIELFDALLPQLLALNPDVIAIVGDHSTPSKLATHSWHPVPLLIRSNYGRRDLAQRYTEDEALKGSLGLRKGTDLMPLLMANALKLNKYGA